MHNDSLPPPALAGLCIVSLALNLPGPAALMRARALGARCLKFEPPAGDPLGHYSGCAYAQLHEGVQVSRVDLKTAHGQQTVLSALSTADVLLTSFRPSALRRLGLAWEDLHSQFTHLSMVCVVGGDGLSEHSAQVAGHDLTYMAQSGLITDLQVPPTLFADMAGSLLALQAIQSAALLKLKSQVAQTAVQGHKFEVPLGAAAQYCALPRIWGITGPTGAAGGAHAGYKIYATLDGLAAVAALESHFATQLLQTAGLLPAAARTAPADAQEGVQEAMFNPQIHTQLQAWFAQQSCAQLAQLAAQKDIPLHVMPRQVQVATHSAPRAASPVV